MDIVKIADLIASVVTILGLPFAIFLFAFEQRKARETEEEEIYKHLSSSYTDFLKLVIANPDLKLRSPEPTPDLSDEQAVRIFAMFEILVSLFERAYLLDYDDGMSGKKLRRWLSWEDFMREWCRREDFRARLPQLLVREDPGFAAFVRRLAAEEGQLGTLA